MTEARLYFPKPTKTRLSRYWENMVRRSQGREPAGYQGECWHCFVRYELGFEIFYRGVARPRNLICTTCWDDPLVREEWSRWNWTSNNWQREQDGHFDEQ